MTSNIYIIFIQIKADNADHHGFLPGKSCVTQLIEVFEQIGYKLDNGEQIDVIYIDMSKAFDKVSHCQLVDRLHETF